MNLDRRMTFFIPFFLFFGEAYINTIPIFRGPQEGKYEH